MMEEQRLIEEIGEAVLAELRGRRGIRQAFDGIDEDIIAEIRMAIGTVALEARARCRKGSE